MAVPLLDSSPRFAAHLRACEEALSEFVEWSLEEVLRGERGEWLGQMEVVQPALFGVMVSLARLWQDCGVDPAAVLGHSQGEIAAAHIAGILSLEDAARIVALRSKALANIAGKGGTMAVSLAAAEVGPLLEPFEPRLSLAAVNGPASVAVSGELEALEELALLCERDGIPTRKVAIDCAAHSAQMDEFRAELLEGFAPISPQSAEIPFYSTVTGEPIDGAELGPDYWYRNLRETVLFEPTLRSLLEAGQRLFVEVSPHPALVYAAEEAFDAFPGGGAALVTTLSRKAQEDDAAQFAAALAAAHAHGAPLEWGRYFAGSGARQVPLPTYPFQRRRYWLQAAAAGGDPASVGLARLEHPLLGAKLEDPAGEGFSLSGRISLQTHPWLRDHAVAGTVLLPGTAFLELALLAAREAGEAGVAELTLQAPLVLPEQGALALRVAVSAPGERGAELEIHSRPQGEEEAAWTLHAQGLLASQAPSPPQPAGQWPPAGAEPLDPADLYDALAAAGIERGPAFQGVEAAWRSGEELYAEASLAAEQAVESGRYAIHPALLDCALQAISLVQGDETPRVAAAFGGAALMAEGAQALRLTLRGQGQDFSLQLADQQGSVVGGIESVTLGELERSLAGRSGAAEALVVEWRDVPAGAGPASAGKEGPGAVEDDRAAAALWHADTAGGGAGAARSAAETALAKLQEWIGRDDDPPPLAVVTRGAVTARPGEVPDPAAAAVWGLVRSAQTEHPGRFSLVDVDDSPSSAEALTAAVAARAGEPQLALREGEVLVPRLRRAPADVLAAASEQGEAAAPLDPERTVLVCGDAGGLAGLAARWLVEARGARHLVLLGEEGEAADGASELRARLGELGASVEFPACDPSRREALKRVLDSIPAQRPLGAVVHAPARGEEGVISSLRAERLERAFAAQAAAAWHLHELSAGSELGTFLILPPPAGALGTPAQAAAAAAAGSLDALASARHLAGLPVASLALGPWAPAGAGRDAEAAMRIRRLGFAEMSEERVLELLDVAAATSLPRLIAVRFEKPVLRAQARQGDLPALLSELVQAPARRTGGGSLALRLAATPEGEHEEVVLELVRSHVAAILGYASAADVDVDRAFLEMGLDSLGALELRNRLTTASGLDLPSTLVFDHPSVSAVARFLLAEALQEDQRGAPALTVGASPEEPIAIVGLACRFPGGASSPEEFWRLVADGEDAISGFPTDRGWDLEALYHPDPDNPGTTYVGEGGFLTDLAEFDPLFFGISPREAELMDPQQRLLLEACWEAMESAGLPAERLRGSETGVFVGAGAGDYGMLLGAGRSMLTGASSSVISGRIAYTFGLEGPAVSVDTACSSSLVALHLAVQALRSGECSAAFGAGVAAMTTPEGFVDLTPYRGLAPDGRCKAFSDAADGTGFSEGVGVVLLERLSDAHRRGHRVLATIRGSAINQDGASNGLTAPNGPSQERVILQALANARLAPDEVDAVEAHGTGTELGDPIEAGALLATYGREREDPVWLGSVKSNIGHAAAAAGIAGVIKMTMALREGVLPKTLHVDRPSTKIDWSSGNVELLTESLPWPERGRPRRAGISAFGMSGTNAHLILEQAPPAPAPVEAPVPARPLPWRSPVLLPLSAKSDAALAEAAARLRSRLEAEPELELADVGYSLAIGRSAFERRAAVLASGREQALEALAALAEHREHADLVHGTARSSRRPVFLFPGQGAHWPGMALQLIEESSAFAAKLNEAREALEPHLEWSFEKVLRGGEAEMPAERPDVVQPMLFSVMVSLAALWRAAGLEPAAVVGQSQGEIAAAHVAGGLTIEDAARVVALRGKILLDLVGKGKMISVRLGANEIAERLQEWRGAVEIAAVAAPSSTVLAGSADALDELKRRCEEEGIKAKDIPGAVGASHSSYVEPLRDELISALAPIAPRSGELPFHSTVDGRRIDTAELDADYWYRNMREPVQLEPVLRALLAQGQRAFVEVGPHPVLGLGLQETIDVALENPADAVAVATLRRREGGPPRVARSLAEAHVGGAEVAWENHFAATGAKRVDLPAYPFQRRRCWAAASRGGGNLGAAGVADAAHPLLAAVVEDPEDGALIMTGRVSLADHPWLAGHSLGDAAVVPGGIFAELALEAAFRVGATEAGEVEMGDPLLLEGQRAVVLRVSVSAPEEGRRRLSIHSRPAGGEDGAGAAEWTRHARGVLIAGTPSDRARPEQPDSWPPDGAEQVDVAAAYDRLADGGLEVAPSQQPVRSAWRRDGELFAELAVDEEGAAPDGFRIAPALLDGALYLLAGERLGREEAEAEGLPLPAAWRGLRLLASSGRTLRVRLTEAEEGASFAAFAPDGTLVAAAEAVLSRPLSLGSAKQARVRRSLHRVDWIGPTLPAAAVPEAAVAVLGDAAGLEGARRFPDLESLIEAVEAGEAAPEVVLADEREHGGELPEAAHAAARQALALAQAWLRAECLREARLVFLSTGALSLPGESPNLAAAPLAGLVHSAANEHRGRYGLVDIDEAEPSWRHLAAALAIGSEPLLAIRAGRVLAPRLTQAVGGGQGSLEVPADGTVLVTGGTSGIGARVARHLVAEHGARHLLLVSRSGRHGEGVEELEAELAGLGAEVAVASCDVADPAQLRALVESIPPERPLRVVIHSAAVLDNGVIEGLDRERLERVMRPKVDAAWHLHELTKDLELSEFLLFSSIAGLTGGSAQANYAAGNVFLDSLARYRQAVGLPAVSIAWGGWLQETNLIDGLEARDKARLLRTGLTPTLPEEGLELLDGARAAGEHLVMAVGLDRRVLREQEADGVLPSVFSSLVPASAAGVEAAESLQSRLAAATEGEREAVALAFVRSHVALVLGYASPEEVEDSRNLQEMGFDSLGAVELRNRLAAATGLQVTVMALADNPTVAGIAAHLLERLADGSVGEDAGAAGAAGGTAFLELLDRARDDDAVPEFLELIARASSFRPSFGSPPPPEDVPRPVRLAAGEEEGAALVLLPSLGPMSGPHEYVRLAAALPGRTAVALPLPGYLQGQRLPRDLTALVEAQAEALAAAAVPSGFVVAGHSSGGWVAHALVGHLERIGVAPRALVLLDTYRPDSPLMGELAPAVIAGVQDGSGVDDARLLASGAYNRIFAEWLPAEIAAPTVLIRAGDPAWPEPSVDDDWRASWSLPHTLLEVSGNHFTMITDDAETTAAALVPIFEKTLDSQTHPGFYSDSVAAS